jgi:hypothetical protein
MFCGSTTVDAQVNAGTGQILESQWAAVGPFTHTFGCNQAAEFNLGNHIAPSHIACVEPAIGEELVLGYIATDAVSTGYTGPVGDSGEPIWRTPNDGNEDGIIILESALANADDVMGWLVTFVENITDEDLEVIFCFGSDDSGQIWVDDETVHNLIVCRGTNECQDMIPYTLSPGIHAIKMAAWDRGGGWRVHLAIQDSFGIPIQPADDLLDWLGPDTPEDYEVAECPGPPQLAVRDLTCETQDDGILVTWSVPESNDTDLTIFVSLNGVELAELDGDAEEYLVESAEIGDAGFAQICVQPQDSLVPSCCGVLTGDEIYINSGGPQVVDDAGRVWQEDTIANPSLFMTGPNAQNAATGNVGVDIQFDEYLVDNEIPTDIFLNERWNTGPVEYTISGLGAESYEVTLFFMEHCCSNGCLANDFEADPCDTLGEDGELPLVDAQFVSGQCRVFDIRINDELVQDQFCKSAYAACLAEVPAGPTSYGIAVSLTWEDIEPLDGSIKINLDDLGAGNPPENASIKGLCIKSSGPARPRERDCSDGIDNDKDGSTDCDDSDCTTSVVCQPETDCGDGVDNDQDGSTDCEDSDCSDDEKACPRGGFVRGDSNSSGVVDLTDGVVTLNFLFTGGPPPACQDAADTDGNNQLVISDAVIIFSYLFTGGARPVEPSPSATAYIADDCGPDEDDDANLDCATPAGICL